MRENLQHDFRHGQFMNSFHTWLEANGVTLGDPVPIEPGPLNSGLGFAGVLDLNLLKLAIITLIREAGGDAAKLPDEDCASCGPSAEGGSDA